MARFSFIPRRKGSAHSVSTIGGSSAYAFPSWNVPSASYEPAGRSKPPSYLGRLLPTWASRLYLAVLLLETLGTVSLEAYFLSRTDVSGIAADFGAPEDDEWEGLQRRDTLPVDLGVFVFAHAFQLVVALAALHGKNTIQICGLVAFNAAFLLWSIIQIGELVQYNITEGAIANLIPVFVGVAEIFYLICAWYIYKDFGWQVYKKIGADRKMKNVYAWWEIFICILQFDFFFWVAFAVQLVLLVLPGQGETLEYWITLLAGPVLFLALLLAYLAVRKEWKVPMYMFLLGCLGALGYFGFKIYRIITRKDTEYRVTWKSMLVFAVISFLMALATLATAIICLRNFGLGLTHYINVPKPTREDVDEDARPVHHVPLYDPHPSDVGHGGKYASYISPAAGEKDGGLRRNDSRMSID